VVVKDGTMLIGGRIISYQGRKSEEGTVVVRVANHDVGCANGTCHSNQEEPRQGKSGNVAQMHLFQPPKQNRFATWSQEGKIGGFGFHPTCRISIGHEKVTCVPAFAEPSPLPCILAVRK